MTKREVTIFVRAACPRGKGVVLLDGLHAAFIGLQEDEDGGLHAVYSRNQIVDILVKRDGMSSNEAREFLDYNIDCMIGSFSPRLIDTP